jgi:hypothetical protein
MSTQRTAVGGLMFERNEEWELGMELGVIVGRRMYDDVGLLCVRHCARDLLSGPFTHSYCMTFARFMLNVPGPPDDPSDRLVANPSKDGRSHSAGVPSAGVPSAGLPSAGVEQVEFHQGPDGPHGAATFVDPRHTRRVFYCLRPPGLIVGVYSCATEFARDAMRTLARRESQHLVWTAVFDRPSWGGSDPLTRVLIDPAPGPPPDEDDAPAPPAPPAA